IDQALRFEPRQCRAVLFEMLALAAHRRLPYEAEPGEILEDRRLEFGAAARAVDILDAQQQAATRRPRHLEIGEGGQRVAEMQKAVRARCEAKDRRRHRRYGCRLTI